MPRSRREGSLLGRRFRRRVVRRTCRSGGALSGRWSWSSGSSGANRWMPCPARAQRPPPTRRRPDATREAGSCAVDGQLVGVGNFGGVGTVYSINPTTGVATPINTGFPLTGPVFGVDFDPVANELRIVGLITGPNLRILNGGTGAVIVDTPLSPDTPHVVGAAYSNNFAGATSTTLYDIDNQGPVVGLVLQTQGSPGRGDLPRFGGHPG
jgi:Domain of unknown function (DUF4394)